MLAMENQYLAMRLRATVHVICPSIESERSGLGECRVVAAQAGQPLDGGDHSLGPGKGKFNSSPSAIAVQSTERIRTFVYFQLKDLQLFRLSFGFIVEEGDNLRV